MFTLFEHYNLSNLRNTWVFLTDYLNVKIPFLTWNWQKTWGLVFPPEKPRIFVVKNGGKTIGIAPFRMENKTLKWLVGEEVSDYLDLICHEKDNLEIWSNLIKIIKKSVKTIELRNLQRDSKTRISLKYLAKSLGLKIKEEKEDVVPYIPLPENFADYLKSLTRKNRHELRRKTRRFENEAGKNYSLIKSNPITLKKDCEIFFHNFKLNGEGKKAFLTEKMADFFCKISKEMQNIGLLDFSSLKINNEIAAQAISFVNNETLFLYNIAVNPKFYHYSPGIMINRCLIEESIQKKRKIYDFMQGSERYKYQLGAINNFVYKITLELYS